MKIIGGKYHNRKLFTPKTTTARPTLSKLRETLFNVCQNTIEGAAFLDLFAGMGTVGLEAISRGAARATFVDSDKTAIRTIEKNIHLLGEENQTRVYHLDVRKALERFFDRKESFDLIFADPPYGKGYSDNVLRFVDQHEILNAGGELFIEDMIFGEFPLENLVLKSSRKVGQAYLNQYST